MKRQVQGAGRTWRTGHGPADLALHDRARGRRLGDRFAGPADELLAHVPDHLPPARNELQRLDPTSPFLAQSAVAAAWAGGGYQIDNALPRKP
jgi:hypothetical protein